MAPTTKDITFEGARVVYDSYGTGDFALVFVHGWCCCSDIWKGQRALLDQYRSITIDLPGHGRSDAPPPAEMDYSMETFAEALAAVLASERITKIVLVGHSMGVAVANMFLRVYPDQVLGIIYVDGPFQPLQCELTKKTREAMIPETRDDGKFRALIGTMLGPNLDDKTSEWICDMMVGANRDMRVASFHTATQWSSWAYKEVFDIPAVHYSSLMGPPDPRWIHHLPRVDNQIWAGFGHFIANEDPEKLNGAIEAFLKQHSLLQ